MRKNREWGGDAELYAISKLYNRSIEVYQRQGEAPIVISPEGQKVQNVEPMRLFYHDEHYDSLEPKQKY